MALFMASHKGATGNAKESELEAATQFFERYPEKRLCVVRPVKPGPAAGLVTFDYSQPAQDWKRSKAGAVRA